MNSRWNSTEAYDLSLYEVPAEPAKRPQPVPAAKNKAQSRKAAQSATPSQNVISLPVQPKRRSRREMKII